MRALLAVLAFALAPAAGAEAPPCRTVDGDTIRCGVERIRLIGVCAAEIGEPGGLAARKRLELRLAQGAVTIERHGRDRYGRTLGHVHVDGERVGQADVGPRAGRGLRWCGKSI